MAVVSTVPLVIGDIPTQVTGITFFDETGINLLAPGVVVSIYPAGSVNIASALIVTATLGINATIPISLATASSYTAIFTGTQAPSASYTFTVGSGGAVVVPNHRSPSVSANGYATIQSELWPRGWFSDAAGAPGGNAHGVAVGFSAVLSQLDSQTRVVLALERLMSSSAGDLDSWVVDYLGADLPRIANESDVSYIVRILDRLKTPLTTVACLQAVITDFYGYTIASGAILTESLLALTTESGVRLTVTPQAPPPPSVYVFDAQSNPGLATAVGIAPPQFCIMFGNPNPTPSTNVWYVGSSFLGSNTYLGSTPLYTITSAPSSALDALVRSVKAEGTVPVYATAQ